MRINCEHILISQIEFCKEKKLDDGLIIIVKPGKNSNFLKNGKTVISVGNLEIL